MYSFPRVYTGADHLEGTNFEQKNTDSRHKGELFLIKLFISRKKSVRGGDKSRPTFSNPPLRARPRLSLDSHSNQNCSRYKQRRRRSTPL